MNEFNPKFLVNIHGKEYYDVAAAAKDCDGDVSRFFPEEAPGYFLKDGIFHVDAETFRRILRKPCAGDGAIKWTKYAVECYMPEPNPDPFDGILPVSRMSDPLYVSMCVPNEQHSFMDCNSGTGAEWERGRVNASVLFPPTSAHKSVLAIGAMFKNPMLPLEDDREFTVCFGRMTLCLRTKTSDGWFLANDIPYPPEPRNIYYLPWTLYDNGGVDEMCLNLPKDRIRIVDGHTEIRLKGCELSGANKRGKFPLVEGSVLHYWAAPATNFEDCSEILGIASSYEIWVKEPEMAYHLTADIGADLYTPGIGHPDQAYTGINFAVTSEPRVVFGHNVGPKHYDEIMDSKKVCEMLGLK